MVLTMTCEWVFIEKWLCLDVCLLVTWLLSCTESITIIREQPLYNKVVP